MNDERRDRDRVPEGARTDQACGATDGLGLWADEGEPDRAYGRCSLPLGHMTVAGRPSWHQEWRDGKLWAEWSGPVPGEKCSICGLDGAQH